MLERAGYSNDHNNDPTNNGRPAGGGAVDDDYTLLIPAIPPPVRRKGTLKRALFYAFSDFSVVESALWASSSAAWLTTGAIA